MDYARRPLFPHEQPGTRRRWIILLGLIFLALGVFGHDPWKVEDATHFGVAWAMWQDRSWLTPALAGNYWPAAPLGYWLAAAATGMADTLFGPLIPAHVASRLATTLAALLTSLTIYLAAARLYGARLGLAAPLLLLGSLGFLVHSHETQPALWLMLAQALGIYGLSQWPQRPGAGASLFGCALGMSMLAAGLPGLTCLLPLLLALLISKTSSGGATRRLLPALPLALLLGAAISASWLWLLQRYHSPALAQWWQDSQAHWHLEHFPAQAHSLAGMLPWFAWPAMPIAGWGLWLHRRRWRELPYLLPLLAASSAFITVSLGPELRSAQALPLLVPLALLAAPGVGGLRRGAANAFDWFAMTTFTVVAGLIWLGWVAMVFGSPAQIARNFAKLEPGFQATFDPWSAALAGTASVLWLLFIYTSPRSIHRGTLHWFGGLTLTWLLTTQLWMPWIDYGKTYRPLANQLAERLQGSQSCVINGGLSSSVRASFDYFIRLRTVAEDAPTARHCRWQLTQGSARADELHPGSGWRKVWEGNRPGDRSEKIRLYRRSE